MERAIGETDRRRAKQVTYNTEHGITPTTITKSIADIMEGARVVGPGAPKNAGRQKDKNKQVIEIPKDPRALGKLLAKLEKQMLQHAQNLEFEEAAALRDQLQSIRDASLKR